MKIHKFNRIRKYFFIILFLLNLNEFYSNTSEKNLITNNENSSWTPPFAATWTQWQKAQLRMDCAWSTNAEHFLSADATFCPFVWPNVCPAFDALNFWIRLENHAKVNFISFFQITLISSATLVAKNLMTRFYSLRVNSATIIGPMGVIPYCVLEAATRRYENDKK